MAITPTPTEKPENPFSDGQTYNGNLTISPKVNTVYGAENKGNESIVNGDVLIDGDINGSITLKNLVINGTLILDPGDEGSVVLENIKADQIEIRSGKKGTIHLNQVDSAEGNCYR